jgi:putative SOS response-associated peptidase YedK
MCGRFSLASNESELYAEIGIAPPEYAPRYNIAPTQPVAAVVAGRDGLRAGWLRWGLVPAWAPDATGAAKLINARVETVHTRPSFRDAFRERRCLVLADGFYEWRRGPEGRTPFHIRLSTGRPFAFAGIWERWRPPQGGEPLHTCALLTTAAPPHLRALHDRVPAILTADGRARWLDADAPPDELRRIAATPPANLVAVPVSRHVNAVANDDPECLRPFGPPLAAAAPGEEQP